MQKHISPQDWEALSAYLDGQQKPRERARLEARLHVDTDLKAALAELQRTRGVLRSSPRLRVPRNFILKPGMIGQPTKINTRLYPAFRFASALTSLLFIIVVLGDITGLSHRVFVPSREAIPQPMEFAAPQADTAPSMEVVEAPAAEEPVAPKEMPAQELPVAEGTTVEEPTAESLALEVSETEVEAAPSIAEPRANLAPAAEPLAEKVSEPVAGTPMEDEQGVNRGEEESVTALATAVPEELGRELEATVGVETRKEAIQEPAEYPGPQAYVEREIRPVNGWSAIRISEVILGVITLILVGITIYLYRQTYR